jgi:hypothetical protein
VETSQQLTWGIRRSGAFGVTLDGGIDLAGRTLDPIVASLTWNDWASWRIGAEVDVAAGELVSLSLRGLWTGEDARVSCEIPYDAEEGAWGSLILETHRTAGRTTLDLNLSLGDGALSTAETAIDLAIGENWGATIAADYDRAAAQTLDVRYGAFVDVGACLRFGVERSGAETWLYASVLAFPEAVLRYSPESASLDVGN